MALKAIEYDSVRYEISYDMQNLEKKRDFIVLHGWGSDKEIMKRAFGRFLPTFRHLYIDLPGFGKSGTQKALTTKEYAAILERFFQVANVKKDIVLGHSFGGKVATLLRPKLLVLLSSAGIVEKKPLSVKAKIALYKMLKPFGGERVRKFFVAKDAKRMPKHMYETFKNVVNEDFTPHFSAYEGEALIFWGREDRATSLKSGEKIASLIEKSRWYPLQGDHYFFLQSSHFIAKKIEEVYEEL